MLSGCGHQVTGLNGTGNNIVQSGQSLFRFEVVGVPDYSQYQYLIVVNAHGDGVVPIANGTNSNYKEWSFSWLVAGGPGYVNPPVLTQYFLDTSQQSTVGHINITYATGTVTFTPLSANGTVNGFDIRFNRCIVDQPSPINPNPGQPTPAPSPHPVGQSCPPYFYLPSTTWTINIFSVTSDAQGNPVAVDSLGNGPADTSYPGFTFDTAGQVNDQVYRKPAGYATAQQPAAQIAGFEAWSQP
ncbi:MAG TPA: hypothetical protein VGN14_13880 [Candidatus Elarobacter sp.]